MTELEIFRLHDPAKASVIGKGRKKIASISTA